MGKKMNYRQDTIAAIATAPGNGGIGIIRMSGLQPRPYIDTLITDNNFNAVNTSYTLRLDRPNASIDTVVATNESIPSAATAIP